MPITIHAVECEEIIEDPPTPGIRKFLCPWTERFAVACGLIGTRVDASGMPESLECVPFRHPDNPKAYCYRVELVPCGPPLGLFHLFFARVIVTAFFREGEPAAPPRQETWRDRMMRDPTCTEPS